MPDWDWYPDHYPYSFFIVLLIYFTTNRFRPEFRRLHDTATIRRSNHKPQQPHRDRRRSQQAQSASSSIVRNKGWYPNEMEQDDNTNIGKSTTSDGVRNTRVLAADAGNFIYLEYNRLHRPTKGDAIVGRYG